MHTVYELPPPHFQRAAPLFARAWFDEMYMEPVLLGRQPGRIFVDDPVTPASAVMFRTYEFYVAGDPVLPMRRFLRDAPAEIDAFDDFYGWCPIGKPWEQALLDDFEALGTVPRLNFGWNHAPLIDWRARLTPGVEIRPLDAALAQQVDEVLHETIALFWVSYERFVQHGFGFVLMKDGVPASVAFTASVGTEAINIGVATDHSLHRQGLAKTVCSALIEETLRRGLLPTWDCDAMNGRSRALAKRLGFVERDPFVEVGSYPRLPLDRTHGTWASDPLDNGMTRWFTR